jgi:hypothetical protein
MRPDVQTTWADDIGQDEQDFLGIGITPVIPSILSDG